MNRRDWNRAVDAAVAHVASGVEAGETIADACEAAKADGLNAEAVDEARVVVGSSRFWQ